MLPARLTSPAPEGGPLEWLNYHHLYYFWRIEQEGGLARAADKLRLTHSTLSAQLKALEGFLGAELFERRGRRLVLTPFGAEVAAYAGEIFRTGAELVDVARGRRAGRAPVLEVGTDGSLPKAITFELLQPAIELAPRVPIRVRQEPLHRLVEQLAGGRLHLVLSDSMPDRVPARVHVSRLGESAIYLYGSTSLVRRHGTDFPSGLEGAPLLLPASGALRRSLDRWFVDRGLHPRVTGEFDDAGLLRVFGAHGQGLFPVRAALRTEVEEAHEAVCLGALDGVREEYFALTPERRLRHPGVATLVERARSRLSEVR